MSARRFRTGFTFVELLVVIAIIGVLVALLLPAVQSAREASRRTKCTNNMRQLMLAMHMHHDAKGGFPPCRTTTSGMAHGWMVDLLPFLEQTAASNNYRLDKNFYDVENQPVVNNKLEIAICPSTPSTSRQFDLGLGATMYGTKGYAGDYFVNHLLNASSATAAGMTCNPCRPVLFVQENEENTLHRLAMVTDGTSNTAFITEQAGRNDYYIRGMRQASNASLTSLNWWGSWPSYQHYQYQGYTADGTALGSACSINCNNGQGIYAFHPGGANTAYVDGSVRFMQQSMSVYLVTTLLTRDGAEPTN